MALNAMYRSKGHTSATSITPRSRHHRPSVRTWETLAKTHRPSVAATTHTGNFDQGTSTIGHQAHGKVWPKHIGHWSPSTRETSAKTHRPSVSTRETSAKAHRPSVTTHRKLRPSHIGHRSPHTQETSAKAHRLSVTKHTGNIGQDTSSIGQHTGNFGQDTSATGHHAHMKL